MSYLSIVETDVSEAPPEASGEDGVWKTTQLDCAIGNLLHRHIGDDRAASASTSTPDSQDPAVEDATVKSDETGTTSSRRGTTVIVGNNYCNKLMS